jgi:hypothetical protein
VTLTVSPRAFQRSAPSVPGVSNTGPVFTATRARRSISYASATSRAYAASARWIASPARTARSLSSSCATGAPKTASRPSPSSWATVPS